MVTHSMLHIARLPRRLTPLRVVDGRWYYVSMKKMSIYMDPDVDRALTRRPAALEGKTKASLDPQSARRGRRHPSRARSGRGFSGPGDLSTKVDEYLRETGFGEVDRPRHLRRARAGRRERHKSRARTRVVQSVPDELCTTPLVLAELDHMVPLKGGSVAAEAVREDFATAPIRSNGGARRCLRRSRSQASTRRSTWA